MKEEEKNDLSSDATTKYRHRTPYTGYGNTPDQSLEKEKKGEDFMNVYAILVHVLLVGLPILGAVAWKIRNDRKKAKLARVGIVYPPVEIHTVHLLMWSDPTWAEIRTILYRQGELNIPPPGP